MSTHDLAAAEAALGAAKKARDTAAIMEAEDRVHRLRRGQEHERQFAAEDAEQERLRQRKAHIEKLGGQFFTAVGVHKGGTKGLDARIAEMGQQYVEAGENYKSVVNIAREILGHGGRSSPTSNTSFENIRNAIQTRLANSGIPIAERWPIPKHPRSKPSPSQISRVLNMRFACFSQAKESLWSPKPNWQRKPMRSDAHSNSSSPVNQHPAGEARRRARGLSPGSSQPAAKAA